MDASWIGKNEFAERMQTVGAVQNMLPFGLSQFLLAVPYDGAHTLKGYVRCFLHTPPC